MKRCPDCNFDFRTPEQVAHDEELKRDEAARQNLALSQLDALSQAARAQMLRNQAEEQARNSSLLNLVDHAVDTLAGAEHSHDHHGRHHHGDADFDDNHVHHVDRTLQAAEADAAAIRRRMRGEPPLSSSQNEVEGKPSWLLVGVGAVGLIVAVGATLSGERDLAKIAGGGGLAMIAVGLIWIFTKRG